MRFDVSGKQIRVGQIVNILNEKDLSHYLYDTKVIGWVGDFVRVTKDGSIFQVPPHLIEIESDPYAAPEAALEKAHQELLSLYQGDGPQLVSVSEERQEQLETVKWLYKLSQRCGDKKAQFTHLPLMAPALNLKDCHEAVKSVATGTSFPLWGYSVQSIWFLGLYHMPGVKITGLHEYTEEQLKNKFCIKDRTTNKWWFYYWNFEKKSHAPTRGRMFNSPPTESVTLDNIHKWMIKE